MFLPLSSCTCVDEGEYGWEFAEPDTFTFTNGPDTEFNYPDEWRDVGDIEEPPDVADGWEVEPDTDPWKPDEVEPNVCEQALNDRTSIVVDDNGTMWLGYHKYRGRNCEHSTLVVSRKRLNGRWVREDIQPHEGIFAVSMIESNRPIAVYPDSVDGEFVAAHRKGPGDWRPNNFDVGGHFVDDGDGFDVTEDGRRFYVTFAEDNAPEVRLYTYDTDNKRAGWRTLRALDARDPRAAMERGLRADTDDSVYLVHRNDERARFGVARYDKKADRWTNRTYFSNQNSGANVHSFVITKDFKLCMSSRFRRRLLVTCGTMFNLQKERKLFQNQEIPMEYPSSMIEGDDGTLYVAFHPQDNSELRVAKRTAEGSWDVQTVYDGPSYGISTAIDKTGDLVMAFYTCEGLGSSQCSLKVVQENPDGL